MGIQKKDLSNYEGLSLRLHYILIFFYIKYVLEQENCEYH